MALAETQGKQLIIAETATHPGCASTTEPTGFGCENEDPAGRRPPPGTTG